MTQQQARYASPDAFDFEGTGDDASEWLDDAYGASLRLSGSMGVVRHRRVDHRTVSFDHLRIDAPISFDAEPLPSLVVVDVLGGEITYSRDGRTDRSHDGDSVLVAGWDMPFTGGGQGYEVRNTSIGADVLAVAIADIDPGRSWKEVAFSSYTPRTPAAGARWRATVDELSGSFPQPLDTLAHREASRLLGHTLLDTFANDLLGGQPGLVDDRDRRDANPTTVRRAVRVIEARAEDELSLGDLARECRVSTRALQYAFRHELGCTPLDYLRRVRLDLVRQSLRSGSAQSVGDVAARYGFFNAGRFAREYRQVFGENPRQTLLRSSI